MALLAVNAGSSSLKFSLFARAGAAVQEALLMGRFEGLEPDGQATLQWRLGPAGETVHQTLAVGMREPLVAALAALQGLLQAQSLPTPEAVAHRVVHGGQDFADSVWVDAQVLQRLERLTPLAPLHQPGSLKGLRAFARNLPGVPQVACFDTAFHASIEAPRNQYALPRKVQEEHGLRRYGFHGLSYQSVMGTLQNCSAQAGGRVLMAHLGNGASLCAAQHGRSQATTMGFSALDGLMMGTRCGAIDPGVLLYLLGQGWDRARLERLLYQQSGLLGVSALSADMRRLRQSPLTEAREAIALFTHRVVQEAGGMVACLQGLDVLAFSGGIGENDPDLRAEVCRRLGWLGVRLDAQRNTQALSTDAPAHAIHASESAVEVWVVHTDEERVVAGEAARLLHRRAPR